MFSKFDIDFYEVVVRTFGFVVYWKCMIRPKWKQLLYWQLVCWWMFYFHHKIAAWHLACS